MGWERGAAPIWRDSCRFICTWLPAGFAGEESQLPEGDASALTAPGGALPIAVGSIWLAEVGDPYEVVPERQLLGPAPIELEEELSEAPEEEDWEREVEEGVLGTPGMSSCARPSSADTHLDRLETTASPGCKTPFFWSGMTGTLAPTSALMTATSSWRSSVTPCAKWQKSPRGHWPCMAKKLHRRVLKVGGSTPCVMAASTRSSPSPCAKWHRLQWEQQPSTVKKWHSFVLKLAGR
mmetsp:Transcript_23669/g.51662  ORF Transcript_23669/g.51662 Transcript_23669/m.51662 type:complete len:237 (-) Transcript_23669:1062-1772(-)